MRRFVLVVALAEGLVGVAPAWGANVTLTADHRVARYGDVVRFKGTLATPEPQQVTLIRDHVIVASATSSAGAFKVDLRVREAGTYVARSVLGDSAPLAVRLRPLLRSRVVGKRRIGHRMLVMGRMLPVEAGRLVLGRSRVRVGADGRFSVRLPTDRAGLVNLRLRVLPRARYIRVGRRLRVRLALPILQVGSHGPSVRALKQRLWELRFALPGVDAGFGYKTYEAVLAFQKVQRFPRTGRVDGAVWRALFRTAVPRSRVRRGDYLEVDKSRQVVLEVRQGQVVNVIHASTGATGNTPLGTWHVYSEIAGWSWVLWQPMYFLRGFAIHGYPEVPPWPASHGCVRVPMWLATSLRERWGYGSTVRVYS